MRDRETLDARLVLTNDRSASAIKLANEMQKPCIIDPDYQFNA